MSVGGRAISNLISPHISAEQIYSGSYCRKTKSNRAGREVVRGGAAPGPGKWMDEEQTVAEMSVEIDEEVDRGRRGFDDNGANEDFRSWGAVVLVGREREGL